ncbi:ciliogenesis and planar polarity effector 2 isoform X3 [Sarcophilus harrisii]|uniref:ciliogenesis and planar polarity effector 2 isoform X3 n=1 Tax=Sarcophilus harrisii TaxID=9305 RepID=UPI001301C9E5|nr:ciliogenesis and planar polarity effector 2 isoform X3 [Sarcophilus harrisii]
MGSQGIRHYEQHKVFPPIYQVRYFSLQLLGVDCLGRAMAQLPAPGSVIVPDWHESAEGKEYLSSILRKNRRRVFGIQTTIVYWPAKLQASDRVIIFRFEFWDCGEAALKKFDHILPACKEKTDAFLFLFSFTDRSSFDDLPAQLSRVAGDAPNTVKMVIGSKFDQYMHTDVPERDLTAFRQAWELPLLRVKSVPGRRLADGRTLDGRAGLADVAHILNGLGEHLWHQDQVAAGLIPGPQENAPEEEQG